MDGQEFREQMMELRHMTGKLGMGAFHLSQQVVGDPNRDYTAKLAALRALAQDILDVFDQLEASDGE